MKIVGDAQSAKIITGNRRRFFEQLGIGEENTVAADIVHGSEVKIIGSKDKNKTILRTDGLLTEERGLFLTLTVADCLPIFLYDPQKEAVGLVHAGWKGLDKGILAAAVEEFKNGFGSNPIDVLIGIGPAISACHFEVQDDVLERFREFRAEALARREGRTFLDLKKIVRLQLVKLGLKEENIETNPECTFCLKDKYFSARRDKPEEIEAMLAVIGRI
ncbi:MAG: peptidoglycan editing factor PgeF [bacterium]|nr:peptidoglycan editing factor PgeF [bacterium]